MKLEEQRMKRERDIRKKHLVAEDADLKVERLSSEANGSDISENENSVSRRSGDDIKTKCSNKTNGQNFDSKTIPVKVSRDKKMKKTDVKKVKGKTAAAKTRHCRCNEAS